MSDAEAGKFDWDALKSAVAVGIEQADRGELEPWDADEIWAEAERRFAVRKKKQRESSRGAE